MLRLVRTLKLPLKNTGAPVDVTPLQSGGKFFVFLPRLNQNRRVSVGIFPQCKEVLVILARFCSVALKRGGTREADVSERIKIGDWRPTAVIQYLLGPFVAAAGQASRRAAEARRDLWLVYRRLRHEGLERGEGVAG